MSEILNHILYQAFAQASEYVYVYVIDQTTGMSRWSPSAVHYFDLPGEYIKDAMPLWLKKVHLDDRGAYIQEMSEIMSGAKDRHSCQYRVKNRFDEYVWVEGKGSVVCGENGERVFAVLITRLDNQSIYDSLTGLKTKNQFYEYNFQRENGAVLMIGIDYFKSLNNGYGYDTGDYVLVQIGKHLWKLGNESCRVFRFNGDEFLFVLPGGSEEDARGLYEKIKKKAGQVELSSGRVLNISFSGAVALYGGELCERDELVNRLQITFNYVKKSRKGTLAVYSEEIAEKTKRSRILKAELKESIDDQFAGFELYYQPWMNREGTKVLGCEALLRWKGSTIKDSYPGEFIPILEETGDMIEVGRWVMQEAMRQQKQWEEKYGPFMVSFNVTYDQFLEEGYVEEVIGTAKQYGVNPDHMVIELTESCSVLEPKMLAEIFAQLREAGFHLALDDFGTGYASLEMLKVLPADGAKIEDGFVRYLAEEGHDVDFTIIRSVVRLCKELGQFLVVEGVENREVDDIIRQSMAVEYLQGYYYSRPVCREVFEELVEKFQ